MRYIKKIILQNFQSHKYSIVELDEQLNVIVGPSDSGKSAIIRALKWVLYNEPSGDYFIREGEKEASVTVEFSDNIKVKRYRSKSKNTYHLFIRDEEQIYQGFGTNVPEEIIQAMEIKKIYLDSDESAFINLGEQLEGAFLLSEKNSVRASAIGRLVGVNIIDDALREGLRDNRSISTIRKNLETNIINIEEELKQYDYLTEISNRVEKIEKIKSLIEEKTAKQVKLTILQDKFEETKNSLKETQAYLEKLKNIGILDSTINKIEELYRNYKYFYNKKESYSKVEIGIKEETKMLDKLVGLDITAEKYLKLSELLVGLDNYKKLNDKNLKYISEFKIYKGIVERLKPIGHIEDISKSIENNLLHVINLNKIQNRFKSNQENLDKGRIYMQNFSNMESLNTIIDTLKSYYNKILKLENTFKKHHKTSIEINKVEVSIKENDLILAKHLEEYGDLLLKQEVCPVCLSQIDEKKIDHIMEHYK